MIVLKGDSYSISGGGGMIASGTWTNNRRLNYDVRCPGDLEQWKRFRRLVKKQRVKQRLE